ncbi:MAG TPA: dTMP kinase [Terriglobales bacterium]|nr:dTMP kinase [Terriglobales bacterium]
MTQGHLIAFEGIEGAGKSTQITLLAEALRQRGLVVRQTREPGGTSLGAEIRKLVLSLREPAPAPLAELLLYLADRAQHLGELIVPALKRGEVVLTDRFSASTIVYQGYARDLGLQRVIELDALVRNGVSPSLTLLLDCPVEIGLGRAEGDDRFHREQLAFHEKVRAGFLALAGREPERWKCIDAQTNAETVHAEVLSAVLPLIGLAA